MHQELAVRSKQTFWNSEKGKGKNQVSMCTLGPIMEVPKKHIQRVVVVLAGGHRNCCLVAAKSEQDKHTAFAAWHFGGYCVLDK